jgi:glycosyltransferase involved in cell wall biosynthesis
VSIAVIILTFNESLHLDRALRQIGGFADEVFVVDSYSTDDTVSIARAHGAQVSQHPFECHAMQFEWALENAPITSEWVMRLDADEIIEPDLAAEIVRELPRLPADVTGVNLKRKTIFQGRFLRYGGRYPLTLLRIWRRGKALIEDRWMDEHMYVTEGRTVTFEGGFSDHSLIDLTAFTDKHNGYATREALDVLLTRIDAANANAMLAVQSTSAQASVKRFFKEKIYNRIPFQLSALGYFLFRYIFQLGFLDGSAGLIYHVLQGFWYRFLVGAKIRELEHALKNLDADADPKQELLRLTKKKAGPMARDAGAATDLAQLSKDRL